MDLSHYIKKSETARRTAKPFAVEKRCLNCGKGINKDTGYYPPSFCSQACKEEYVSTTYT